MKKIRERFDRVTSGPHKIPNAELLSYLRAEYR
jgi:hypothetical protein